MERLTRPSQPADGKKCPLGPGPVVCLDADTLLNNEKTDRYNSTRRFDGFGISVV